MRHSETGFTLIELLVAMAIFVVVLGVVGVYFARQAKLSKDTQAHAQVQDTARSVMQLVTNDLLSAGATQYVATVSGATTTSTVTGLQPLTASDGGLVDGLTVEYVSSLRSQANACRRVGYQVVSGVLERSDVACTASADSYVALANHVLAFDLAYVCSDSPTDLQPAPGSCPASTYVRSVQVSVMLRSDNRAGAGGGAVSYASTVDSGASVTCPSGYDCAVLTQVVQTPNLKDK
ncbi:MAG: prepilin-type N-terminal cleavage/methylation domain-containing protein [Deinococcales bacterium]